MSADFKAGMDEARESFQPKDNTGMGIAHEPAGKAM
jgi:hypothetical protein